MDHENNPLWNEIHKTFQEAMKKEIETMREILANLHQEELSLVLNDKITLDRVMKERTVLVNKLELFKKNRIEALLKLKALYPSAENKDSDSLKEMICPANEECCETLFLRDQHTAIFERIHLQSSRNKLLLNLVQSMEKKETNPNKKKKSVTTMTEGEEEKQK